MYKVLGRIENSHLLGHHGPQHLVSILDTSVRRWCQLACNILNTLPYAFIWYPETDKCIAWAHLFSSACDIFFINDQRFFKNFSKRYLNLFLVSDLLWFMYNHCLSAWEGFSFSVIGILTTVDSLLTDTSLKRTLRVGPCLSLLILFDSL